MANMNTLWKYCSMVFLSSGMLLQLTCPALLVGEAWTWLSREGMPMMATPCGVSGASAFVRNVRSSSIPMCSSTSRAKMPS